MKIVIAAGGTGGHLFPAQQLAEMLGSDVEILFAGHHLATNPFFAKRAFVEISSHPFRLGFFTACWRGFWQSIRMLRQFDPDVVVGFGSYHVFPILLAASLLRKKIVLFEANCALGKVNRFFAPVARKIAFQFPFVSKKGVQVPWLPWIETSQTKMTSSEAREFYGLDPDLRTLLVFGGSQGASFLNESAPEIVGRLAHPVQVLHLAGNGNVDAVQKAYDRLGIISCVKAFEPQMLYAYSAATVAFCRSGAGTVAELLRFALPALLVPYPFATEDHQRKNGDYLAHLGGARVVVQKTASKDLLASELETLFREAEPRKEALMKAFESNSEVAHLAEIIKGLR